MNIDHHIMELPVGYRFMPTDEELVVHYLINKACCRPLPAQVVQEITSLELYHKQPKFTDSSSGEKEWYFFIPEEETNHSGKETVQFVGDGTGFWKLNGEDIPIYNIKGRVLGFKTKFTYFSGINSKARKTLWKLQLFRLPSEFYTSQSFKVEKWVLARFERGLEFKGCF